MTATETRADRTAPAALDRRLDRLAMPLLRWSLGLVYAWFGALKVAGATPAGQLVADTVPLLPDGFVVPAIGLFEIALGVALAVGRWVRVVVAVMIAHLGGTFLVLVVQPQVAFQDGNPLLLSMVGEFVVKNVVLISAGLAVAARGR